MFSLIITIISIALVALLAVATIYYGGSAFTRGGDGATAARLINEGQQLNGARVLAQVDNAPAASAALVADLAPTYLSQIPANWTRDNTASVFSFSAASLTAAVCTEVNTRAGLTGVQATLPTTSLYACVDNGTARSVQYRF
jgi:hypothetical protein